MKQMRHLLLANPSDAMMQYLLEASGGNIFIGMEILEQFHEARASLIRQIRGRSISLSFERETTMVQIEKTKTKCPNQNMLDNLYTHGLTGHLDSGGNKTERKNDSYGSWVKNINKDHIIGFMIAHGSNPKQIKDMIDWLEYDTDLLD